MKNLIKILIISLILSTIPNTSFSFHTDNQNYKKVIARELYFLYVLANDWKQTRDISKNKSLYEKNPIMGKHPDNNNINTYFASCAAGHILITYLLPGNLKEYWQVAWIGIQSNQIQENDNAGLNQNMGLSYSFKYSITF